MTEKTHRTIFIVLVGWIIPIADIAVPLWLFYALDSTALFIILSTAFSIFLNWLVHKIIDWDLIN